MSNDPASEFAIKWWKNRHDVGYFPAMDQHLNWRIYPEMIGWFEDAVHPTKQDRVLEVGCGYGQWMIPLSGSVAHVTGVDIHETLVAKAQESFAEYGVKNATALLGDGLSIPCEDRSFSLVYSISVFQHMPRAIVLGYLREIDRVLTSDGRTALHFRHADGDGPYSEDILPDHTGDWSVGWSEEEVAAAVAPLGWRSEIRAGGNSLILIARK